MNYIDLHCHTTHSDGKLTPRELVREARKKKLAAIAITDHDTVAGIPEAVLVAQATKIRIVPGCEITCDDQRFRDVHVLALGIDHFNPSLKKLLTRSKKARLQQKKDIIKRCGKLGYPITFRSVAQLASGEIGRPHIAQALLQKYPESFSDMNDIFATFLGYGKKAYVARKDMIRSKEAIAAIHDAGGVALVAHPHVYHHINPLTYISYFIRQGGDGIETLYEYHTSRSHVSKAERNRIIKKYRLVAKKYGLLESGGSDFHSDKSQLLGSVKVPESFLAKIDAACNHYR